MEYGESRVEPFDKVRLDIFEGPLDLLLTLIRENDLDIYELSLAKITEQYLEYVELLKEFDFDNIGDYMVIAAELGRIKSRSLLPEEEKEESIEDESDLNLIEMLKEYKKYRALSENLNQRTILGRDTFKKSFDNSLRTETIWELETTDIWKLVTVVKNLLKLQRYSEIPDIEFEQEVIDQVQRRKEIKNLFQIKKKLKFTEIFVENLSKDNIIVSFLIILEMINDSMIDFTGKDIGDLEFFIREA
jgi:segregation and condensation protein A